VGRISGIDPIFTPLRIDENFYWEDRSCVLRSLRCSLLVV